MKSKKISVWSRLVWHNFVKVGNKGRNSLGELVGN